MIPARKKSLLLQVGCVTSQSVPTRESTTVRFPPLLVPKLPRPWEGAPIHPQPSCVARPTHPESSVASLPASLYYPQHATSMQSGGLCAALVLRAINVPVWPVPSDVMRLRSVLTHCRVECFETNPGAAMRLFLASTSTSE